MCPPLPICRLKARLALSDNSIVLGLGLVLVLLLESGDSHCHMLAFAYLPAALCHVGGAGAELLCVRGLFGTLLHTFEVIIQFTFSPEGFAFLPARRLPFVKQFSVGLVFIGHFRGPPLNCSALIKYLQQLLSHIPPVIFGAINYWIYVSKMAAKRKF